MAFLDEDSGLKFSLSIRSERPVEGCELSPHAFLFIKGGSIDNLTRSKMIEARKHYFLFNWSRGPRRSLCENESCPRTGIYDPIHWSRTALGGPCLQCVICEKYGIPKHQSLFCSKSCFEFSWKTHSLLKHSLTSAIYYSQNTTFDQNEDEEDNIIKHSNQDTKQIMEWIEICNENTYVPTNLDVGCVLKLEVKAISMNSSEVLVGPSFLYLEPVLASPCPPPKRQLLTIPSSTSSYGGFRFRVLSYNILAELYATKQFYPYCDSWILSWPYRRCMLLQELDEAQGDIVCLQEVQADHFEQYFYPFMQERGYEGGYKAKTREAMGQYGKVDGCAVFWKSSKFVMVEQYDLEFNELAKITANELSSDESECRRYLNRLLKDNVAQVVVLETVSAQRPGSRPPSSAAAPPRPTGTNLLCVVNTHLYSNVNFPEVKIWQAMSLMGEIEKLLHNKDVPLLLCGDLNSDPQSAVYEFLVSGSLGLDRWSELLSLQDPLTAKILSQCSISHNIDLSSAMRTALSEEPGYTYFTAHYKGTLDYILYSTAKLRVLAVSSLPEAEDLEACGGCLPSAAYPSDHLMLCVDLAFSNPTSNSAPITQSKKQQQQQQQQSTASSKSKSRAR